MTDDERLKRLEESIEKLKKEMKEKYGFEPEVIKPFGDTGWPMK